MISNKTKIVLISVLNTFLSVFIPLVVMSLVALPSIEWSYSVVCGVVIAAFRVAVKAVVDQWTPTTLGGVKK